LTDVLCGLVRLALIRQLITDTVGNDVRVQRFLLDGLDLGVNGLKRECCCRAASEASLEF
jgi:hypothetical protein